MKIGENPDIYNSYGNIRQKSKQKLQVHVIRWIHLKITMLYEKGTKGYFLYDIY